MVNDEWSMTNRRGIRGNVLYDKSMAFALRIYRLNKHLIGSKEYSIADQILRSGTSIGANVAESCYAESKTDFSHKLSIARKEGQETLFWLELLFKAELIDERLYNSFFDDCDELMRLLSASIKKTRNSKPTDDKV